MGLEAVYKLYVDRWIECSWLETVSLHYTFTDSSREETSRRFSKYALDYVRYNFGAQFDLKMPWDIRATVRPSYYERAAQGPYCLLDARASKRCKIAGFDTEFYIDGTNLLNMSYTEIGGVVMPGLWLIGVASVEW